MEAKTKEELKQAFTKALNTEGPTIIGFQGRRCVSHADPLELFQHVGFGRGRSGYLDK